jgi:hypothetical protein
LLGDDFIADAVNDGGVVTALFSGGGGDEAETACVTTPIN